MAGQGMNKVGLPGLLDLYDSDEDDSDDEPIEESVCKRWHKRKEVVDQRDVPGIENAHLAMDMQEGVEVVWNEVLFSKRRSFQAEEVNVHRVFESLTLLNHPNIITFHDYWTDSFNKTPRVVFITEYMACGSLKQFIKRTKQSGKMLPLDVWKRWCMQILSALKYLHSCSPPIIHGNLTCDSIFIQHNGLIKIGSVAPDVINRHVKTCRLDTTNLHFIAPEYAECVTPAIDIYSFGICALEIAALEIMDARASRSVDRTALVNKGIAALGNQQQADFVRACLVPDSTRRPSAKDLLFHPSVYEVPSLKLLAAHAFNKAAGSDLSNPMIDQINRNQYDPTAIVAEIYHRCRRGVHYKISDVPNASKLNKFVEDVSHGIYPLTVFLKEGPPLPSPPSTAVDVEKRRVVSIVCQFEELGTQDYELSMTILLRFNDNINRQLTCSLAKTDTSLLLAEEMVQFALINMKDREKVGLYIYVSLRSYYDDKHLKLLPPVTKHFKSL